MEGIFVKEKNGNKKTKKERKNLQVRKLSSLATIIHGSDIKHSDREEK